MAALHHVNTPLDTNLKKNVLSDYMFIDAKILGADILTVGSVERTMMDSGALHASFIRADVLDRNPFLKTLQKPSQYTVTLGDGENTVSADTTVTINMILPNAQGKEKTILDLTFLVMPKLSCPIIIGLPHIVKKIPSIFISHFVAAMDAAHQAELQRMRLTTLAPQALTPVAPATNNTMPTQVTILNLNQTIYVL